MITRIEGGFGGGGGDGVDGMATAPVDLRTDSLLNEKENKKQLNRFTLKSYCSRSSSSCCCDN